MSDFASNPAIPFAVGSLTGIRCWRVTPDGTLLAVNHSYRYAPGENKAGCAMGLPMGTVRVDYPRVTHLDHHAGVQWCSCGFYAYYSGGDTYNQYAGYETITGIVQAYGRCTYGRNGFRAEKLKILAIVNPFLTDAEVRDQAKNDQKVGEHPIPKIPMRRRLKSWYFRGPKPFFLPLLFAVWFIMSTATLGHRETDLGKVIQSVSGIASFGLAMFLFHKTIRRKTAVAMQRLLHQGDRIEKTPPCITVEETSLTKKDYSRVKAQYPNVPHYRSVEEALKIFPLTDYFADTPGGRQRR